MVGFTLLSRSRLRFTILSLRRRRPAPPRSPPPFPPYSRPTTAVSGQARGRGTGGAKTRALCSQRQVKFPASLGSTPQPDHNTRSRKRLRPTRDGHGGGGAGGGGGGGGGGLSLHAACWRAAPGRAGARTVVGVQVSQAAASWWSRCGRKVPGSRERVGRAEPRLTPRLQRRSLARRRARRVHHRPTRVVALARAPSAAGLTHGVTTPSPHPWRRQR